MPYSFNSYEQGALVRVTLQLKDAGGNLVDPDQLWFAFQPPGLAEQIFKLGAQNSPIVRDSIGTYHCDVDTTPAAGFWYGRWYSIGVVQVAVPWVTYVNQSQVAMVRT